MRGCTAGRSVAALLLLAVSACTTTVDGAATSVTSSADRITGSSVPPPTPTPTPTSGYVLERRLLTYQLTIGNPPDTARTGDPPVADVLRTLAQSRGVEDVDVTVVDRTTVEVRTTASPEVVDAALAADRKLRWLPVAGQKAVSGGGCDITTNATRQCSLDGQLVYSLAKAPFELTVVDVQAGEDPRPGAILQFDAATAEHVADYTAAHIGETVALLRLLRT